MKRRRKLLLIGISIFFIMFGVLSILSRPLHIYSLPRVSTSKLKLVSFPVKRENTPNINVTNPNAEEIGIGVPKDIYKDNGVFIISKEIVNGEERTIARKVMEAPEGTLVIGEENEVYYQVVEGLSSLDEIITLGYEELLDGDEVYVER